MGPGSLTTGMWTQAASEARPCPGCRHDYVKLAAWVFALLFGPALAAIIVLLI